MAIYRFRKGSGFSEPNSSLKIQLQGNGTTTGTVTYKDSTTNGQYVTLTGASFTAVDAENPISGTDTLTLPTSFDSVTCSGGSGTYSSTGELSKGAGYYQGTGLAADAGDWAASSN